MSQSEDSIASTKVSRSSRRRDRADHHVQVTNSPVKRVLVDHTYIDHYHDSFMPSSQLRDKKSQRTPRGGVTVAFPEKLHEMLSRIDEEGLSHIVSWQPHGRCFLVHRKKEFIDDVMPRFFHQSKLTSFQRQLNLYGFVRLTAGRDRGGYYHELFLRGRPDLCRRMIRTRVKGNGMKAASNPQNEPNFYSMEFCSADASHVEADDQESQCSMDTEEREEEEEENLLVQTTDASVETTQYTEHRKPPVVTPVSSPRQSMNLTEPPKSMFLLELPDPNEIISCSEIAYMPGSIVSEDSEPHSGDEVFFEGLKFRYLDHLDLDNEYENPFVDHSGDIELV